MNEIERVARLDAAIEQLTNHQQQADMDGTFVTVSRQALEELLSNTAAIAAMRGEPVAWMYSNPSDPLPPSIQAQRHDAMDFIAMRRRGWTETALYAGPTPPDSGKD
jgi:hypothetical protein